MTAHLAGAIYRGEIWKVDFGTNPADPEQAFIRPALIVSDDRLHHPNLNMTIVVPGTSTLRRLPLHVTVDPDSLNGLETRTAFQVEQVRSISAARLLDRLGSIDSPAMFAVEEVLRNALRL